MIGKLKIWPVFRVLAIDIVNDRIRIMKYKYVNRAKFRVVQS